MFAAGGGAGGWYSAAFSVGLRQRDRMQTRRIVPGSATLGEVKYAMVLEW